MSFSQSVSIFLIFFYAFYFISVTPHPRSSKYIFQYKKCNYLKKILLFWKNEKCWSQQKLKLVYLVIYMPHCSKLLHGISKSKYLSNATMYFAWWCKKTADISIFLKNTKLMTSSKISATMKILFVYMKDLDTYYHPAKFHVNTLNSWLNLGKKPKNNIALFLQNYHISRLVSRTPFCVDSF